MPPEAELNRLVTPSNRVPPESCWRTPSMIPLSSSMGCFSWSTPSTPNLAALLLAPTGHHVLVGRPPLHDWPNAPFPLRLHLTTAGSHRCTTSLDSTGASSRYFSSTCTGTCTCPIATLPSDSILNGATSTSSVHEPLHDFSTDLADSGELQDCASPP
jgi:hypothetical protein